MEAEEKLIVYLHQLPGKSFSVSYEAEQKPVTPALSTCHCVHFSGCFLGRHAVLVLVFLSPGLQHVTFLRAWSLWRWEEGEEQRIRALEAVFGWENKRFLPTVYIISFFRVALKHHAAEVEEQTAGRKQACWIHLQELWCNMGSFLQIRAVLRSGLSSSSQ